MNFKESCLLAFDEHFSFKYFVEKALVRNTSPK